MSRSITIMSAEANEQARLAGAGQVGYESGEATSRARSAFADCATSWPAQNVSAHSPISQPNGRRAIPPLRAPVASPFTDQKSPNSEELARATRKPITAPGKTPSTVKTLASVLALSRLMNRDMAPTTEKTI